MNALLNLADGPWLRSPGWSLAGWTMLHFLWAGTAVAAAGAAARLAVGWASPPWRYAASLTSFAALALTPVAIASVLAPRWTADLASSAPLRRAAPPPDAWPLVASPAPQVVAAANRASRSEPALPARAAEVATADARPAATVHAPPRAAGPVGVGDAPAAAWAPAA